MNSQLTLAHNTHDFVETILTGVSHFLKRSEVQNRNTRA